MHRGVQCKSLQHQPQNWQTGREEADSGPAVLDQDLGAHGGSSCSTTCVSLSLPSTRATTSHLFASFSKGQGQ